MERMILLLVYICGVGLQLTTFVSAQMISQPPVSTTAALGTNATFSCCGAGSVLWQINGTQVQDASQVPNFESILVYVPLPRPSSSELIVTATEVTNASLMIICLVDPGIGMGDILKSDAVHLLVYAEPNPPVNLSITVDGLSLVATWSEPFSLQGEELSYVIFITGSGNLMQNFSVNETEYEYFFSEPIEEMDCIQYIMFTVFSENEYSRSIANVSERNSKSVPTVPLVIKRSDVRINVTLFEEIQITLTFNPRDPCPAYPVTSYIFNISDDNGNFIDTISHMGNTSITINGSDYDLGHDQVYRLIVEAINDAGSTPSEEILLYTTGLQSSTAVVELNGSITITCTFAPGASSTGCQVTIFKLDSLQEVFLSSTNIIRPNGSSEVSKTIDIKMIKNCNSLLIQTVELLREGEINNNISFNRTINCSSMATSTTPSTAFSTTSATTQVPSEYIIIVAVLLAVLVFILMIAIITCVIFALGAKRKSSWSGLSSQSTMTNRDLLTPAYESVEIDRETVIATPSIHNPVYSDKVIRAHYEMQDLDQVEEETAGDSDQLKDVRDECDTNIPTDPITGYSTLIRPDKSQPTSSQVAFYESVKVNEGFVRAGDKGTVAVDVNCQYSTLKHDPQTPLPISHTNSHHTEVDSEGKSPLESVQSSSVAKGILLSSPAIPTMMHTIPTDPETGYSSLLRPDKVVPPPPGPPALYDIMINIKDEHPLVHPARSNNDSLIQ